MTGLSVFFHATISRIGAQSGNSVVQLGAAMKGRWFVLLLAGALVGWPHIAHSQNSSPDYPDRPITLVVPYASGGGNTLGLGGTGTLAIDPTLYPNAGYDPRKDFAPVGLIATGPLIILVNQSVAAQSVQELIALAKAQPGQLNYASAGVGSGIHLGTVLFAEAAGIQITHVPYKGTGPALTDLLGGHVQIYFSSLPPAIGLVKEGRLRALGVTGLKRSASFPDVPTVAEQGLPGFEAVLHYGIVAPAGTPRPIIDKLNAALRSALRDPKVNGHIANEGAEPLPTSPEEYAADIDREETKWSALVKKTGAQEK
jgi:tripartite-type tricarboxylate transporter receptor subunit TctC